MNPNPDQPKEKFPGPSPAISPSQRKGANKSLQGYAERFRCSLPGLLRPLEMEVRRGDLSLFVFAVLVERVDGQEKRNELKFDEVTALERAKNFLKEFKQ